MNITLLCTIVLTTSSLLFGARVAPTPRAAGTDRPYTISLQRSKTESNLLGTGARSRRIAVAPVKPETRTLIVYDAEIHQAAAVDDLDELKYLLAQSPEILDLCDKATGNTPLHAAVIAEHTKIVCYLLAQDAARDIINNTGKLAEDLVTTPEMQAIFINDQRIRDAGTVSAAQQYEVLRSMVQMTHASDTHSQFGSPRPETTTVADTREKRWSGKVTAETVGIADNKKDCCVIQ